MPPHKARRSDRHLFLNLWIAVGLLALLHLVLLVGLLSRRSTSPKRLWLVEYFPIIFIAVLFATLTVQAEILWSSSRYTGPDPAALQVEVTGMQFAWYFRYPGRTPPLATGAGFVAPGEGNPVGSTPLTTVEKTTSSPPNLSYLRADR